MFIVDVHFTEKNDLIILTEKILFYMKEPYEELIMIELDMECKMVISFSIDNHLFFFVAKIDGSIDLIELQKNTLVIVKKQIMNMKVMRKW